MYSDEEDVPLLTPNVVAAKTGYKTWKFIVVAVALSALGLVAVSVNGGLSSRTKLSQSELSAKRLQMTKEGSLMYGALSDDEMSTLFDNFKVEYSREVSAGRLKLCSLDADYFDCAVLYRIYRMYQQ